MELERLVRRQAIWQWRDGHILATLELFNRATKASLAALDDVLPRASAVDLWDPDDFAAREIDPLMRRELEQPLEALMAEAAVDLKSFGAPYHELADALAEESSHIAWPASLPAPVMPADPPTVALVETTGSRLAWLADTLGSMARNAAGTIGQISDSAGQTIRDRTGLHDRLRNAARRRIAIAWMGDNGMQRPVMSHVILMLDETASQARSMV